MFVTISRMVAKFVYPLLFLFASSIFLFHYVLIGQAVYGDGIGYYAHLHSWYFDHDWDSTNEYKHHYSPQNNNALQPTVSATVQIVGTAPDGKALNHYSPGVAMLLLPFYVFADFVVQIVNAFGANLARNGYSDIYQIISGLGAVLYGVVGVYLLEKLIYFYRKEVTISRLSAVTIFLASSLLYYGAFDVLNSHFASFFLTTLFLYVLFTKTNSIPHNLLLGLIGGLLISVRLQDGLIFLLWGIQQLQLKNVSLVLKNTSVFLLGLSIAVLPLLIHWQTTFGSLGSHTYISSFLSERHQGEPINLLGSLLHPTVGLLTTTPLLLLLLCFYVFLLKKRRGSYLIPFVVFFILQYVVITLHGGYWAAAYGGRMYISCLPLFGLLLAEFLVFLKKRKKYQLGLLLCGVFMIFNVVRMGSFILFEKGAEGGRTGTEVRTQERLEKLLRIFQ